MILRVVIAHRETEDELQRNGLFFERIRYWADVLPSIAQPREPRLTRYDPRDFSRLYVLTPSKSYQPVPYADVRHPPITLAELRFAHAELRREARGSINEEQLFAMHADATSENFAGFNLTVLSGQWSGTLFGISRFPSRGAPKDFWFCDRYQQTAIPLRLG